MATRDPGQGAPATPWLPLPQPVPRPQLVFALLTLLLLARQPRDLIYPQFNAEEGTHFFQQAFNSGFLDSLFSTTSGYFHLALRLTAGLALLVPLELAPLVFKLAGLAVQLLPVAYLLSARVPGFAVTAPGRILIAALYLAGPNSDGPFLSMLNSQWHLTFAAALALLAGPRPGRGSKALDAVTLPLFAMSGPFSIVCAPLALWSWQRSRRSNAGWWGSFGPLLVLAGAAIQSFFLFTGTRATAASAGFGTPTTTEIGRIIGLHWTANSLFGSRFMLRHHEALPEPAFLLALALVPLLAFVALRLRSLPLLVLLVLSAVGAAIVFLFPLNDPRGWLNPLYGTRYFFFASLLSSFTLVAMAERGGGWRLLALPGLATVLLFGIRSDFFIPPELDTRWPDQVAAFRTLPRGAEFFIPVLPQYSEWGLTLRRKKEGRDGVLLAQYSRSGKPLRSSLGMSVVTRPGGGEDSAMLVLSGFALDALEGKPAAGVFLAVGGRIYPAVMGRVATTEGASLQAKAGFARVVPLSAIGPGPHNVELRALDHSGTMLLERSPSYTFVVPR